MFDSIMRCAWACDDSLDLDNAIYCRKLALEVIEKLQGENKEDLLVIKADILRRSGQFDIVINKYKNKKFKNDILNKIIKFQILKCNEHDVKCYTVSDALGEED